ncbi:MULTISPECIES: Stk1 family PASTA domain-containing Ser/Thr kinase [Mediterraneibacter]|jgi:serine/threonine protein kinase/beta-lactam-binding protein with PASTA domain|uniref:Stk1 family PASTA domain-containing Ser/Thr kinase n=1 Tax=Mediterraneibacter TaxID=2316020 RepID=UPI000E520948|nr:Stk1 family PASTA domain-containing Ser/Thr kinase [Mediterraneibacter massiliensis]RGT73061.1 Stk1 family PASTA domain-containing Ser/Thr kinase [Ruminococcus sp. AF18-22]
MIKEGVFLGKRYEILGRIGSGGMADVYKGKDHKLNRYVAIKVLKSDFRTDEVFIQKFLSEAQAAAGLMHPNVVNVYDVGQDRGLYYMVMELVEGITLKEYIEKKGKLSAKEAISISIQMVTGIQAAHNQHIVHRDIKPQNIIISKDGKVKVTDFGIARATTSTNTISASVMGSVHYTSPEQARGGIVDEKSDIYSAGITMYEMVTGHVPFDGDSTVSVAIKHLQEEVPSPAEEVPDLPYSLECIILKCTQKNPSARYLSCEDLILDLKRSLVDPEGDFVVSGVYGNTGDRTVVMSTEELDRLQKERYDEEDDYDGEYDEDEEDDYEDDRYTKNRKKNAVDPNTKKIMKILMIVAAAVIALAVIFMVANAAGLFKGGAGTTQTASSKVTVPNVTGMTEEEAQEALNKKKLGMVVSERKESDKYDKGEIISQDPGKGKKVAKNTEIKVVVSTGKKAETVAVPDVAGQDEDKAQKALENANLVVTSEGQYDDSIEEGKVISTDPTAGTEVKEGSTVKMYVSLGAEPAVVPNIVGMWSEDAANALYNVGLNPGNVTEEYSDKYEAGIVISQKTKADKKVDKGSSVDYVISKGPQTKKVSVPSLSGYSQAQAEQMLINAGLNVGQITYENSEDFGQGIVIRQSISGSVDEGTYVDFVVSNGSGQTDPGTDGGDSEDGSNE